MNQTTPKTITLKYLYEEAKIDKYYTYEEFRKLWNDLVAMIVRDGWGMGKKVKLPFVIGVLKPVIRTPKKYSIDIELSRKLGFDVIDDCADMDGNIVKILWFTSFRHYPNILYYTYKMNGKIYRLLRKYTAENKLTGRR